MPEQPTHLAIRISTFVSRHDRDVRGAVYLACNTTLLTKIGPYVDPDGWVEWDRLAADLISGLPWSSGEKRLARLACSLSGQIPYAQAAESADLRPWALAEMLSGLDDDHRQEALRAIELAATGHLPGGDALPSVPASAPEPRRYEPDPRCEFCQGAGCDICLHRLNAAVEWERVQELRARKATR